MMEDIPVMRPSICFDVQKILGVSTGAGNVITYQVQWAPVWISSTHLVGCDHLIAEFYKMQSGNVLGNENQNTKKLEFDKCEVQIPVKNREFSTRYSQHADISDKSFGVETESKLSPITANEDNIQVLVIEPEFIVETSVDENVDVMHKHDKNRNFEWVKEKVVGGQENDMITCKDNFSSIPKENGISLAKEEVNLSHQFPDINIEDTVLVEPAEPEMYYDLNQVKSMNIPSNRLKCSSCKMTFSSSKELMLHQNECHGPETRFNKNHASDDSAIKKRKKENDVGKVFSCQNCLKTFLRESSLLSHTCGLSCPHCGKLFPSKRNLLRHIRVHTGEKPFKCDVCGLRFSRKDYLKTHLDSHNNAY